MKSPRNVVYQIICTGNDKRYIGSTVSWRHRKAHHKNRLKSNKHSNAHLQYAYNKYGIDAFVYEIIESVLPEVSLLDREQYWIDAYDFDMLFNAHKTAYKVPDESRIKMGASRTGERNGFYGKRPEKAIQGSIVANSVAVIQIDKDTGERIKAWNSIAAAANALGISKTHISDVCRRRVKKRPGVNDSLCKTCGGYVWRYADKFAT